MTANAMQALHIKRWHAHLGRLGWAGTLDQTAAQWIKRFAALWRERFETA